MTATIVLNKPGVMKQPQPTYETKLDQSEGQAGWDVEDI